jgi:MFS transporter, MCT family, solute carrier family 16 (monocarboxylic acid transporters), member 10
LTGSLLFNPINAWLISCYDFRVAFRCAAILILLSGVGCCWNFSAREDVGVQQLDEHCEPEMTDDEERSSLAGDSTGGPDSVSTAKKCCTWAEIRRRPETVLWYIGNCLSYLGFYMPFVNLVCTNFGFPSQ